MAHPALLNADIVSIICESLGKHSLSALARTARFLQGPALRELWREIELPNLLSPFGSSIKKTQGKFCFCGDPTLTQWDRFNFYAQLVRDLTIPCYGSVIEPTSLRILAHRQPLLPRLKSLIVLTEWGQDILSLSMFFVPSIQRFTFRSCQDFVALESLLMTLGTTASALRHLDIAGSQLPTSQFAISIPLFHKLYSIDIPLTGLHVHSILSHLSTLPLLSIMHFSIIGLTRTSGTGPKYFFPTVRELFLRSESEDQPTYFLALTCFDNLSDLRIFCESYLVDDASLCTAISVSCGLSLERIRIGDGMKDPRTVKITTLDPLSKFKDLCSFTLAAADTPWPTDDDILDITKIWPDLEEFHLEPYFDDNPIFPLTLTGVLLLIEKCPWLMEVSVPINARQVPNFTRLISREGLAIVVNAWYSLINNPNHVANFLSLTFPDADITMSENSAGLNYGVWMNALALREYFFKGWDDRGKYAIEESNELLIALVESRLENARLHAELNISNA